MKKFFFNIIYFILFLFLLNNIFAQNYYANIDIYLQNDGKITIKGLTNYEPFQNILNSHQFTSKNGEYWTLNLNSNETFDSYLFNLYLPNGAILNYIKTTKNIKFDEKDGKILIIGKDTNKELRLLAQYKILDDNKIGQNSLFSNQVLLFVIIGIFFLLLTLLIVIYFNLKIKYIFFNQNSRYINIYKKDIDTKNIDEIKEEKEEKKETELKEIEKERYDFSILPQRQKDIINILKEKRKITQKELEILMQIPKSSLSRNLRTLEIKEIIKKEQVGQTNYISLK